MEYTFKTKQMMKVSEEIGTFYDLEKAVYDNNISVLVKLISIFGSCEEEQALEEVDRLVDDGKKIADIYKDIFDGINKKGFFKQKLQHNLEAPPVDTERLIQQIYQAQMEKEIENVKTLQNT